MNAEIAILLLNFAYQFFSSDFFSKGRHIGVKKLFVKNLSLIWKLYDQNIGFKNELALVKKQNLAWILIWKSVDLYRKSF